MQEAAALTGGVANDARADPCGLRGDMEADTEPVWWDGGGRGGVPAEHPEDPAAVEGGDQ